MARKRLKRGQVRCERCGDTFVMRKTNVVAICGTRFILCKTCRPKDARRDAYDTLIVEQDSRCRICGRRQGRRRLAIDHDHTTGKIRGLLCGQCNLGLGCFKDNPLYLVRAIKYLEGKLEPRAVLRAHDLRQQTRQPFGVLNTNSAVNASSSPDVSACGCG